MKLNLWKFLLVVGIAIPLAAFIEMPVYNWRNLIPHTLTPLHKINIKGKPIFLLGDL